MSAAHGLTATCGEIWPRRHLSAQPGHRLAILPESTATERTDAHGMAKAQAKGFQQISARRLVRPQQAARNLFDQANGHRQAWGITQEGFQVHKRPWTSQGLTSERFQKHRQGKGLTFPCRCPRFTRPANLDGGLRSWAMPSKTARARVVALRVSCPAGVPPRSERALRNAW